MIWGFCVYFVYMIPLETDVLRKHRFQKLLKKTNVLFLLADINNISFITMPKQIQKKTPQYQTAWILIL